MRYLITGGAGFIGSNFIHYLMNKEQDSKIINLDKLTYCGNLNNLKEINKKNNYTFIQGDIQDYQLLEKIMPEIDIVINFAADSHVDRSVNFDGAPFIQTDVYGTYVLLTAIKNQKRPVHFHQVSTDEVYGDYLTGFARETDPLKGSSPYAASKGGADLLVFAFHRTYGLPITITRCTNNYGPYQYPEKLIPLFITNLLEGKKLPLYDGGTQIRDWLYVTDHCAAIDLVVKKGVIGEVYNVGANQNPEITNGDITERLLSLHGKNKDEIINVKGLRPGHDQRYAVNTDKIKKIGWKIKMNFEEGIEKTYRWYKENEWWWKPLKDESFKEYYQKHYKMRL